MNEKVFLLLLGCVTGLVTSVPLPPSQETPVNGMNKVDSKLPKYEDDILLTVGRSSSTCNTCVWPKNANGTVFVPYTISGNNTSGVINTITTALKEYETLTCLSMVNHTTERDYLDFITNSDVCASFIGRIGGGQQIYLHYSCVVAGSIQHEVNHALGFSHEHTRMDRDNYINIMFQFISEDSRYFFDKKNSRNTVLGYDYDSVMHYRASAFSNTSYQPSIVPKPDPNVRIGQRYGLSVLDVDKINRVYQCNVSATLLDKENGVFTSAKYPSDYPNNVNHVWLIRTPSGQVTLSFNDFNVQSSPDCSSDYMRIYDGPTKNSAVLWDKFCGSQSSPPLIASTHHMLVEFVSDGAVAGLGFSATYSSVQCARVFYSFQGNVSSPNYPDYYGPNLDCTYTITAPVGYRIALHVKKFTVEYIYNCNFDYLEVYVDEKVNKYCGDSIDSKIISTGASMVLKFHSDGSVGAPGFLAYYTFF